MSTGRLEKITYRIRRLRYAANKRLFGSQFARKNISMEELHSYWKSPPDESNQPGSYISQRGQIDSLVSCFEKHVSRNDSILEIGCNSGRNLNALLEAGYKKLSAIEINNDALKLLAEQLPTLAATANLRNGAIEDIITGLSENQFDVVFTVAVLLHIHEDSEWVFAEMVRITGKKLVVIEAEQGEHYRIVPRDYRKIFTDLGMEELDEFVSQSYGNYTGRVFGHANA